MKIIALVVLCAVAHAGSWKENSPQIFDVLDVGINSDVGYGAAIENGVGTLILKTADRGVTWEQVNNRSNFLAIACSSLNARDAAVSGVLGKAEYTIDGGKTWHTAAGVVGAADALARGRLATYYAAAEGRGVSVSTDEGLFWERRTDPRANSSRFAAIVDDNTWYFTTGQFISPSPPPTPFKQRMYHRQLTSRISHTYDREEKRSAYNMDLIDDSIELTPTEKKRQRRLQANTSAIWGEIWKTSDAGKSWKKVYSSANLFYFNAIDCCSASLCYAVAEGDTPAGSTQPGARIFKTEDGTTFKQIYFRPGDGESMMGVKCLSSNEAYASGSTLVQGKSFGGHFFFTNDGGKTWADQTVRAPVLFMDMSDDGKYGLASGLTRLSQGVTFGYD